MKKITIACFVLVQLLFPAVTEEIQWGGLYQTPDILLSAALAFEGHGEATIFSLSPAAEYLFYEPVFGTAAPLDLGVIARLRLAGAFGFPSGFYLGAGIGAAAHLGFNGLGTSLNIPLLNNLEFLLELGLAMDFIRADDHSLLGLFLRSGFRYLLNEKILLEAAYSNWRIANGVAIGVTYKLGESRKISGQKMAIPDRAAPLPGMMLNPYLMQFQAIYLYSFFPGGYYFDDSTYDPGDGTIWKISSDDAKGGTSAYSIERSLLKIQPDGAKWWKIRITPHDNGKPILYEFLITPDLQITRILFKDPDSGEIMKSDETENLETTTAAHYVDEKDQEAWNNGQQSVSVAAGNFRAEYLKYQAKADGDNITWEWWISNKAPGRMIRFHWQDTTGAQINGELMKILTDQKQELNGF